MRRVEEMYLTSEKPKRNEVGEESKRGVSKEGCCWEDFSKESDTMKREEKRTE